MSAWVSQAVEPDETDWDGFLGYEFRLPLAIVSVGDSGRVSLVAVDMVLFDVIRGSFGMKPMVLPMLGDTGIIPSPPPPDSTS